MPIELGGCGNGWGGLACILYTHSWCFVQSVEVTELLAQLTLS